MLPDTLNANQIKDRLGAGVNTFESVNDEGRTRLFRNTAAAYNRPQELALKHRETGSGIKLVRDSAIIGSHVVTGDDGTPCKIEVLIRARVPVGNLASKDPVKEVIAMVLSFSASLGVNATILYDGTGNGAVVLINGSL